MFNILMRGLEMQYVSRTATAGGSIMRAMHILSGHVRSARQAG